MTTTVTALPPDEQVRALAAFAADQLRQTTDKLKQRVPELAEEPLMDDGELILSIPATLGKAIGHYARLLLDALDCPAAGPVAARSIWRTMLNTCVVWRDDPALSADLHDALSCSQ
ncbi:hypothetical protein [Streptomyces montanisoli]|uniref:Uncharacterized protein n=1 Tax=Streptomyces montanisoli TaxID=2798581 RepID=A0A940MFL0_9ACTN|nr:hypothetical protein [Streptomyces montanisoli]MBP0460172.1 hypothetical protein [Streptomyces montanisoli]